MMANDVYCKNYYKIKKKKNIKITEILNIITNQNQNHHKIIIKSELLSFNNLFFIY